MRTETMESLPQQQLPPTPAQRHLEGRYTVRSMDHQQHQQQLQERPAMLELEVDVSPNSHYSNISHSSSTCSSSTSSAPQYSEDLRRTAAALPALDLLPRQGSASSSTKTCEVDLGDEERDTFSPVSSSPSEVEALLGNCLSNNSNNAAGTAISATSSVSSTTNNLVDNKVYEGSTAMQLPLKLKATTNGLGSSGSMHATPTKEEKQRQNEEIVIMETSSISSETGSWESVFPHSSATVAAAVAAANMPQMAAHVVDADLRNCCTEFLHSECKNKPKEKDKLDKLRQEFNYEDSVELSPFLRERTYSTGAAVTADTSSLFTGISNSSLLRDLEHPLSTSATSACFIDASSLRDEDEVLSFPSLDGAHDVVECTEKETQEEGSPTKQLEEFYKSFAKCKNKPDSLMETLETCQTNSTASSNSGGDSPQKAELESAHNLSDEEKLWKREHDVQQPLGSVEIKQHSDSNGQEHTQQAAHEDATEASISLAADVDSSDSSVSVKLRLEQQRKQIPYTFQHNMQQFSIHPLGVSPKFAPHNSSSLPTVVTAHTTTSAVTHTTAHSDLSYTTDYSSSSPAPSLVWSEHEHRPSYSSVNRHHHVDEATKNCHMPDTPHNSIAHIEQVSSNTSSIHRDYTLSSSFSHQRDSGAYCSDATDSPIPLPRTPKRSKFDESNPIVSGGASIKDFNIKQCESPPVVRRTDACPIVSGGFVSLDFEQTRPLSDAGDEDEEEAVEMRVKPKTRKPISGIASWVVDMSDCRRERRKSTSSTSSSVEAGPGKFRERSDSNSSHKSGCGFYVSLDDMDKKPQDKLSKSQMSKSYTAPKSAGFFVNLSQSEYQDKEPSPLPIDPKVDDAADKKNIFSMFIDFGDKKARSNGKKEPFNLAQRLSSSLTSAQRRTEEGLKSTASSTETLMAKSSNLKNLLDEDTNGSVGESKSLDYKCNIEPSITVAAIRRISQQQRAQSEAAKRHSWGNSQTKDINGATGDYKRSISLTANGDGKDGCNGNGNGLMSIIDKLPIISKTSSLSVDSSLSPYDEYTVGSKSGLSSCSNNSARNSMSGGERDEDVAQHNSNNIVRIKKRRRDVQINETFDKSSLASITDGVLSKDLSPASTTDTDDLTFQQDEELALREAAMQQQQQQQTLQLSSNRSSAIIMETIIETKETSSPKKNALNANGHTMESLHATIEKQKMLLETVNEHAEVEKSTFVKLSDMDKPVKFELNSPEMSKSVGNHRQINRLYRDDTKGRPHSWTMTRSTGNSFMNITNSVDNLRSLSRLFPNFSKEFSNSLPNDMVLDQMDYIQTDLSGDSSLASSFSRSGMDESSISCRQPRRLGEDLLKMFLQEIATDMIVEVHGRRIKAHKCILRSRCQYFAAMLAGTGSQSVVSLQGYSYSAVHFALCHIYSGASHPPDGISLMELAALADLLGLEGLKEVTSHALKTNYCHNFHKPCSGCIDGILQVLPVALNHALDDLYRKCLRWTCRHYLKVWPTRQFAQLPPDILGRCRQQIVAYLTSETVLDTVLDCDHLLAQLSAYRWGGICENLVRDILDAAYTYIADHFASLIASDAFLSLGHDRSRHIPRLEGVLLRTAASLTPDQACRSYQRVTRLNTVLQAKIIQMPANMGELARELQGLQEEELEWDPEYIRLVSALLSAVEQCLIRQCSRAMRVTAWQRMDLDLRKKIQTLARITEPLDMKRNSKPVGKAFSFGGSTRNQDLIQVKLAIQAHSKRALAHDTQLYKSTQTQDAGNVQTAERGVQANHDLREGNSKVLKSNSRAHVPQSYRANSQSVTASERNSVNNNYSNNNQTAHRRTQSEAPQPTHKIQQKQQHPIENKVSITTTTTATLSTSTQQKTTTAPRLTDVRPRYLEPRKSRTTTNVNAGPVRSATSSSIPATHNKNKRGLHISSSDSSRNSSPAARRNITNGNATKNVTKSINMSMDSLASPAGRRAKSAPRGKSSDTERYSDINVDSLAESMKSSMRTNKTISHESLTGSNTHTTTISSSSNNKLLTRSNNQLNNNKYTTNNSRVASKNTTTGRTTTATIQRAATIGNKPPRHLQQQNIVSTGSSPSSVHTTKSATSRLSSVSSTQSTRELFKHRSISVPAGDIAAQQTQRRSFLSAKSREILAKRAEKNKQQQQQQLNSSGDEQQQRTNQHHMPTGPMRSASHSAVTTIAGSATLSQHNNQRNSMPSNIPTRRPNTLQLKKTTNSHFSNNKANILQTNTQNNNYNSNSNKHNKITTNGILKTAQAVKQKLDLLIDATMDVDNQSVTTPPLRIESKLERSSTFCKDSADLDVSELQIIE